MGDKIDPKDLLKDPAKIADLAERLGQNAEPVATERPVADNVIDLATAIRRRLHRG